MNRQAISRSASVLRVVQRLLLGFGAAALVYAAGMTASAGIYQQYQSWKFGQEIAAHRAVIEAVAIDAVAVDDADLRPGDVVGRLEIPRLGLAVMVLHGIEEKNLILGVGHVPGTPLPGVEGNVAIAGHRDTFFRKLEGILPGDTILFLTVRDRFEYVVDFTERVDPADTYVMESRARSELTLITCYPFYFVGAAPQRFIVHARPLAGPSSPRWNSKPVAAQPVTGNIGTRPATSAKP